MTWGFEAFDENGNLVGNDGDMLSKLVEWFDVGQNETGSRSIPEIDGVNVRVLAFKTQSAEEGSWGKHRVYRSGNSIVYDDPFGGYDGKYSDFGPSRIVVLAE